MEGKHFAMVHGICHGAWCWYKLKPRLESAGHKVTVLDLAASGINPKRIEDVHTFSGYSEPLLEFLDSLPPNEKVILVGHSFGGLSLALAMDRFPQKIIVGVFLAAFMPDTQHKPSYVLEQQSTVAPVDQLDTEFWSSGGKTMMIFGPKCLSRLLYQLCSVEDLELAKALIRPGSLFIEELSKAKNFSEEGYGSIPRVYVVCKEDLILPTAYQRWMIRNSGANEVLEMEGADHMAVLSKPQQVYHSLLQIAQKYT